MDRGNIHIIPDDTQGGIIALALENSVAHLLRLFLHPILSQRLRGYAHKMKDVSVSDYEGTIRLDKLRPLLFLNLHKTAEAIGNIIGQPGAAESRMGSQTPNGKLSHIQLHILLECEKQSRQPVML